MTGPGIADRIATATTAAVDDAGLIRIDEAAVAAWLDALHMTDPHARAGTRQVLLELLEEAVGAPLAMRVGAWEVSLPWQRMPGLVTSALLAGAVTAAGVDDVPLIVLAALVPLLFTVQSADLQPEGDTVTATLTSPLGTPDQRSAWWQRLPADLRHELTLQELDGLVERLERAGALRDDHFAHTVRPAPSTGMPHRPVILAVADEWFPAHGGVSSLNRRLCKALAAEHTRVFCLVPAFTPEEFDDARGAGVELLRAAHLPGRPPRTALMRRPPLPPGVVPDVVLGHSRLTGQEAKAVTEDHFPAATRLHLVHMSPDEIEWFKVDREDDAGERAGNRTELELDLARGAALIVAIGPRLHARFERDAHAVPGVPPVHRLDPGFDADDRDREPTPGSPLQVLVTGRIEDAPLKGLDIAAQAVGRAVKLLGVPDLGVEILVRGAPAGTTAELRSAVLAWAGTAGVSATPRLFTTDAELLTADLRRAVLLLMPSRAEGFGLVGLEAIEQGTPSLISGNSGLGLLLREVLPARLATQVVLPVRDDALDAEVWGAAVFSVLRDLPGAFATAAEIRAIMARQRTWGGAAKQLLQALRHGEAPDVPV
ncbi:glycosyltransferase [Dactylosporangium sp. NPDC050588]|uniref:glycosyltransferase family 4 protein n=1 Tax=Dactylosporangium sp. NPDC050588 TaxID=3157211 RepID=UPI003405D4E9